MFTLKVGDALSPRLSNRPLLTRARKMHRKSLPALFAAAILLVCAAPGLAWAATISLPLSLSSNLTGTEAP